MTEPLNRRLPLYKTNGNELGGPVIDYTSNLLFDPLQAIGTATTDGGVAAAVNTPASI